MTDSKITDKELVKQWLSDYVAEVLSNPWYRYMSFSISENSGYIYIKVTDKLRPKLFINYQGSYEFNTHLVFRQPSANVYHFSDKSIDDFKKYIKQTFDDHQFLSNFLIKIQEGFHA